MRQRFAIDPLTGQLRLRRLHYDTHLLGRRHASLRECRGNRLVQFGIGSRARHVRFDQALFGFFLQRLVLSPAFPSRLLTAFPPGTPVRRVGLEEALQRLTGGLSGEPALPVREEERE